MRRRDFLTLVGGAALWPLGATAQSATESGARANQAARFRQATSHLASGRAMLANDRFAVAIRDLERGIATLGKDYSVGVEGGVIDDTSMIYITAQNEIRKNKLRQAAHLLERVLKTRLGLFAQKYHISN